MKQIETSGGNIMTAHREWMRRPNDERFQTLDALEASVKERAASSRTITEKLREVRAEALGENELGIVVGGEILQPTNWGFGQVAGLAGAPGNYLARLPAELAADCLNVGFKRAVNDPKKMLVLDAGRNLALRAATSDKYGRIWDIDVVQRVKRILERTGDTFFNPKDWNGNPAGLYASDRDVFMFYVDGGSMVDGGGPRDQLNRGFIVWNSETGARTFGIATFLFRQVCGNHIIWGAEKVNQVVIRHSSGAPERFENEASAALRAYAEASAAPLEATIRNAKAYMLPSERDERAAFFRRYGFTEFDAKRAEKFALEEEGSFATLWDAVNGFTAAAREIEYADARVDAERKAGKLLELVSGK